MYYYGCSLNDIQEQRNVLQLAFDALSSVEQMAADPTDRLFIYPINYEYNVSIILCFKKYTLIYIFFLNSHWHHYILIILQLN